MKKKGLVVKVDENYMHTVPTCYKCGREIEPQLKKQWFIRMKPLAERAERAINSGEVSFITDRYRKIALHWLSNIQDWNISRQIVWGIPIPAKVCEVCGEGCVDVDGTVSECPQCSGAVVQDPDTFDTWFSSGQLPFIALGYPDGGDFTARYPTTMMETGHDILFFWVVRMLMLGLYRTGNVPFETIYLHGVVRDAKGQKMSKSKGNGIDPLDVAAEYGVDALRMALIVGVVPGESMNFSMDKVRGYRKFANKIWNIGRFVLAEAADGEDEPVCVESDRELIAAWRMLREEVTDDMEHYRYHLASEKLYHYLWHEFADNIIETSKDVLKEGDAAAVKSKKATLLCIYTETLKMLHPFMPFITEAVWNHIPERCKKREMLMVEEL